MTGRRNPGVWTGRAWNISFFFYFYACLCHIELQFCVRNQGNYEMEKYLFFREWQITATRDSSKCDKAMQVSVSSNEQKPIKIKHIFTRIPEVALLFSSSSSVYPLPRYYWPRFPLTFYETSNESETIDKSQEKSTITEEQKEMHFICHVNHVWYLSCDLVPQKSFFLLERINQSV